MPTYEFQETFETGAWSGSWTSVGLPTVTADAAINGSFGLKITGAGAQYIQRVPSPANPSLLTDRITIRVPTGGFPTGANATWAVGRTASGVSFRVAVALSTGNLYVQIGSGTIQNFGTLIAGSKYDVDFRMDCSSTTGKIDWEVNGAPQTLATATIVASTFSFLRVGNENGGVTGMTLHIDDVAQSQLSVDYPLGPLSGGGGGGPTIVPMGMADRQYSYGYKTASQISANAVPESHPGIAIESIWLPWQNVHPTRASHVWTVLNQWIDDAELKGYKIVIRVVPGGSSPSFIYTDPANPVASVSVYLDPSHSTPDQIPIMWDVNLRVHFQETLTSLKANLDGLTVGGHPRYLYVEWMATSMFAHPGTEMWIVDDSKDPRNLPIWDAVSTGATEAAKQTWRQDQFHATVDASLDDMKNIMTNVRPCLAGGSGFNDASSKFSAIPAERAATMPNLIGMFTNGQPAGSGTVIGPWKQVFPSLHNILVNWITAGLGIGMQSAAAGRFNSFTTPPWNPNLAFEYTSRDMIGVLGSGDPGFPGYDYPLLFWEVNPALLNANKDYCLTQAQPAIMAQGGSATTNNPPSLSIVTPTDGATYQIETGKTTYPLRVQASASDSDGSIASAVSSMDAGTNLDMSFILPNYYIRDYALGAGSHTVTVTVVDDQGAVVSQTVNFTLLAPVSAIVVSEQPFVTFTIKHLDHNGNAIGEALGQDFRFGKYLGNPGFISYDLDRANKLVTPSLEPHALDWGLYLDGELFMAGEIDTVDRDTDVQVVSVAGNDWQEYLNTLPIPYDPVNPKNFHRDNTDLTDITEGLVDFVLSKYANSITLISNNAKTGIAQTWTFMASDLEYLGDMIDKMATQSQGFDWEITADKQLLIYAPKKTGVSDLLVDESIIKQVHYGQQGIKGTTLYGRGTGSGTSQLVKVLTNSDAATKYRDRVTILDYDISSPSNLNKAVTRDLNRTSQQMLEFWVTIVPPSSLNVWKMVEPGWNVRIKFNDDNITLDGFYRCVGYETYITTQGDAEVTLNFNTEDTFA